MSATEERRSMSSSSATRSKPLREQERKRSALDFWSMTFLSKTERLAQLYGRSLKAKVRRFVPNVRPEMARGWIQRSFTFKHQCATSIPIRHENVRAAIDGLEGADFASAATIEGGRVWGFTTEDALLHFIAVYGSIIVK
jgi:hypothetical protein